MTWLIVGLIIVLIAIGVACGYKAGEYHELHRLEGKFNGVEKKIFNYFKKERETVSHDGVTFGELPKETVAGAGFAVQKMLEIFDNEREFLKYEFVDFLKRQSNGS